jgi:hypothetical protein
MKACFGIVIGFICFSYNHKKLHYLNILLQHLLHLHLHWHFKFAGS